MKLDDTYELANLTVEPLPLIGYEWRKMARLEINNGVSRQQS